jgi:cation transport regulator
MPYAPIEELPASIQDHLPVHAQEIFRGAFNGAWEHYGDRDLAEREEIAHRVAWAAVERSYHKVGDFWELRE